LFAVAPALELEVRGGLQQSVDFLGAELFDGEKMVHQLRG